MDDRRVRRHRSVRRGRRRRVRRGVAGRLRPAGLDRSGSRRIDGRGPPAALPGVVAPRPASEVDEDAVEPPVPPGLGRLSAALSAVAEFLRIDPDLVDVAAERSAPLNADDTLTKLPGWLAQLPEESKDAFLLRVARGDGARVRAELLAGCRRAAGQVETGNGSGRSAETLLMQSLRRREDRQRVAREHAQRRAVERRRTAERARENHLSELAGRQERAWQEVVGLVERRTAADYDTAAGLLYELAELCRREGTSETFAVRVKQLRREQRRKISFIQRLDRLGMV